MWRKENGTLLVRNAKWYTFYSFLSKSSGKVIAFVFRSMQLYLKGFDEFYVCMTKERTYR